MLLLLPLIVFAFIVLVIHRGIYVYSLKEERILLGVFFAIFFLLLCLRGKSVGVDLENYLHRYYQISRIDLAGVFEKQVPVDIGYGLLNKLFAVLGVSDRVFIILIAILTVFPLAWLYITETDNWMLTVSLFIILPIFSMCFTGLRQSLAIAAVPLQFYFTKKKNIIGFLLAVLLAYLFHSTAIFTLILYPVYHIRIKKTWLLGLIPLMAAIYIFNRQLYSLTVRLLGGKFEERYSEIGNTGAYEMLLLFILFAVVSFVLTDENLMDDDDFGLRNLLLLTVVFQFFAPVNSIAMRLNYYFLVFIPIAVPHMLVLHKVRYRKFALAAQSVMVVAFSGYFLYKAYRGGDSMHVFKYVPFWRDS